MTTSIHILSGFNRKAAAAISVRTTSPSHGPVHLLLDAGGCLEGSTDKGWELPHDVDAILISHDHHDHIGGLKEVPSHIPVYATDAVQPYLPEHLTLRTLPNKGVTNIKGVRVQTGSAGHSFGGVWFHIAVANGIFYSGDFCNESELFPMDRPPQAATALLDASYGLYERNQHQAKQELLGLLSTQKPNLMPVPQSGRALEMACWFEQQGLTDWVLGEDCLQPSAIKNVNEELISAQARALTAKLLPRDFRDNAHIILCGDPEGFSGDSGRLLKHANHYNVIYTGHLPTHAREAVAQGKAHFSRWNVHPTRQDLARLIDQLQCQRCVPLFCPLEPVDRWRQYFGGILHPTSTLELST